MCQAKNLESRGMKPVYVVLGECEMTVGWNWRSSLS
jgi:ERCC4-type nuclease